MSAAQFQSKFQTKKSYLEAIKSFCVIAGWKDADTVNKYCLECRYIELSWYQAAAKIIVAAYKKANW